MKRKIGELILIIFFYLLQVTLGRVIAIGGKKTYIHSFIFSMKETE